MTERPTARRLRIFAFDPSLATRLETATINELTLEVPWEDLEPGPTGEYLEVIDVDPASGFCYDPVNLNDARLLAQDGHRPDTLEAKVLCRGRIPIARSAVHGL